MFQEFAIYTADLTDTIIRKLDTKKLKALTLKGKDWGLEWERNRLTETGAALIANHANHLNRLELADLEIATILHGNKPLVNLEHLTFRSCYGSLDSVLGICRKLKTLEIGYGDMIIGTLNFTLPVLKSLILEEIEFEIEDFEKFRAKLPTDMIRNNLMDFVPPSLVPEA